METTAEDVLAAPAPVNSLPPGAMVQEYRIGAVVGEGGFGIVYRALDTLLEREVAIKEYLPVSHAVRRGARVEPRSATQAPLFAKGLRCFVGEAQMLARFKHPALVEVLRFWEENGTAYMVMPFYRGRTLREVAQRDARLKEQQNVMQVLRPLLGGLAVMHAAECYHRDISVDNILLLDSGAPVLLDFGAARSMLLNESDDATVILKPGFAPIEQYSGDQASAPQGPWTDIYALSAVLYQVIAGEMPAPSVARIIRDPVVPLSHGEYPGFSRAFLLAIDRGMAVKPEDRPQTIAAFERLLMALDEGQVEQRAPAGGQPAGTTASATVLPLRRPPADEGRATTAARPSGADGAEARSPVVGTPRPGTASGEDPGGPPEGGADTPGAAPAPAADDQGAMPERRPVVLAGVGRGVWIGTGLVAAACALGAVLYLALGMNDAPIAASVGGPRPADPLAVAAGEEAAQRPSAMSAPLRPPVEVVQEVRETGDVSPGEETREGGLASRPGEPPRDITAEASPAPQAGTAVAAIQPGVPVQARLADLPGQGGPTPAGISQAPAGQNPAAGGAQAQGAADRPGPAGGQDAGEPAAAGAAATAEAHQGGTIQVTVRPWGHVYLNGQLAGTVPPRLHLSVPAGASEIEIRNESHPPHVVQLRVRAGETVQVSHDFLRAAAAVARGEEQPSSGGRE